MACLIRLLDVNGSVYFDFFIKKNSDYQLPVSVKEIKTNNLKTTVQLKKGWIENYQTVDNDKNISESVFPFESLEFTLDSKTPSALVYLPKHTFYHGLPITSMSVEHMTLQELLKVENYHNQNQNLQPI